MREIKFRAWEYAHEFTDRPGWKDSPFVWKMNLNPGLLDCEYLGEQSVVRLNDALRKGGAADYEKENKSIFMQYTGLKDKNGKEVYEGDILHFTYWWFDGNEAETPLVGEVTYLQNEASFGLKHIRNKEWLRHIGAKPGEEDTQSFSGWHFSADDMEVIGNIYENPELLENKS